MKTPREILLERHAAATGALDEMRERVVNEMVQPKEEPMTMIGFLMSLRWHAAAMAVAWFLVAGLGGEKRPAPPAREAALPGPSAFSFLAWREFDEQTEPMANPAPSATPVPHACIDPCRREERNEAV